MDADNEDFRAYRKLIIRQLEVNEAAIKELQKDLGTLKTQLAVIKAQSLMLAGIISCIFTIASLIVSWLKM